ncbi:MAG: response regulator [Thiotrichales bacterium]
MKNRYLTVKQVAELLLVSPGTVRNWCERGDLPVHHTPGGHRRFLEDEVTAFAARHEIPMAVGASSEKRILVVDDDRAVSAYVCELLGLASEPLSVDVAFDGFEAGDKLHSFQPDTVLLDLRMPGMDGFEVCKHIKGSVQTQAIRVIAMTALAGEEHRQKILAAGAEQCLSKPFESDVLFEALGLSLNDGPPQASSQDQAGSRARADKNKKSNEG